MAKNSKQHRFSSVKEALECIIEQNGCHIFQGTTDSSYGYGIFKVDDKSYRAHRASFEYHHGKIPEDKIICHRCNVKLCINPDHIYAGTRKENAIDRMNYLREKEAKGRIETDLEKLQTIKEFINEMHLNESKKFTMIFPRCLYDKLKMMCLLTRRNMSEFIRLAIIDKINQVKLDKTNVK